MKYIGRLKSQDFKVINGAHSGLSGVADIREVVDLGNKLQGQCYVRLNSKSGAHFVAIKYLGYDYWSLLPRSFKYGSGLRSTHIASEDEEVDAMNSVIENIF